MIREEKLITKVFTVIINFFFSNTAVVLSIVYHRKELSKLAQQAEFSSTAYTIFQP
jgi:hypothetical protein